VTFVVRRDIASLHLLSFVIIVDARARDIAGKLHAMYILHVELPISRQVASGEAASLIVPTPNMLSVNEAQNNSCAMQLVLLDPELKYNIYRRDRNRQSDMEVVCVFLLPTFCGDMSDEYSHL